MSESAKKITKGKKKKLQTSLVVTLKTPITRRNLLSVSTGGFTPKESEAESVERPRKRRVRRTDHSLYVPKQEETATELPTSQKSTRKIRRAPKLLRPDFKESSEEWSKSTAGQWTSALTVPDAFSSSDYKTGPSSPQNQRTKKKKSTKKTKRSRSANPVVVVNECLIVEPNLNTSIVNETKSSELKLPLSERKVLKEKTKNKMKRTTIAVTKLSSESEPQTPLLSLKPRRSLRKRWSDELKNEWANNSNIMIKTNNVLTPKARTSIWHEGNTAADAQLSDSERNADFEKTLSKPRLSRRKRWSDELKNDSEFTKDIAMSVEDGIEEENGEMSPIPKFPMSNTPNVSPNTTEDIDKTSTLQSKSITSSTSLSNLPNETLPENNAELENEPNMNLTSSINLSGTRRSARISNVSGESSAKKLKRRSKPLINNINDFESSTLSSNGDDIIEIRNSSPANKERSVRRSARISNVSNDSTANKLKRRSKSLINNINDLVSSTSCSNGDNTIEIRNSSPTEKERSVRRSQSFKISQSLTDSNECVIIEDDTINATFELDKSVGNRKSKRISANRRSSTNFTPQQSRDLGFDDVGTNRISARHQPTPHPINRRRETYELEESVMDTTLLKSLSENSNRISVRYQPTPLPKRRETYELEESVTDTTLLKALSESNDSSFLSELPTNVENTKKVRFQHVTMRRKYARNDENNAPTNEPRSGALKKSVSFEHTVFSPSTASTPFSKSNIAKEILARNTSQVGRRRSRSADEYVSKPATRTKMPDFAKLHQKAADKLESIADLSKRKAERARLLLSGQKPPSSVEKGAKKSHKQLDFNNLPSTSGVTQKKEVKNAETAQKWKVEVKKPQVEKPKSRFGFKGDGGGPENKNVEMKAVATKTKPMKDQREEKRTIIKGVRSNKRFELLMKMRQQK